MHFFALLLWPFPVEFGLAFMDGLFAWVVGVLGGKYLERH
jgi:hypothetical protein